jgi:hypothetical protein
MRVELPAWLVHGDGGVGAGKHGVVALVESWRETEGVASVVAKRRSFLLGFRLKEDAY